MASALGELSGGGGWSDLSDENESIGSNRSRIHQDSQTGQLVDTGDEVRNPGFRLRRRRRQLKSSDVRGEVESVIEGGAYGVRRTTTSTTDRRKISNAVGDAENENGGNVERVGDRCHDADSSSSSSSVGMKSFRERKASSIAKLFNHYQQFEREVLNDDNDDHHQQAEMDSARGHNREQALRASDIARWMTSGRDDSRWQNEGSPSLRDDLLRALDTLRRSRGPTTSEKIRRGNQHNPGDVDDDDDDDDDDKDGDLPSTLTFPSSPSRRDGLGGECKNSRKRGRGNEHGNLNFRKRRTEFQNLRSTSVGGTGGIDDGTKRPMSAVLPTDKDVFKKYGKLPFDDEVGEDADRHSDDDDDDDDYHAVFDAKRGKSVYRDSRGKNDHGRAEQTADANQRRDHENDDFAKDTDKNPIGETGKHPRRNSADESAVHIQLSSANDDSASAGGPLTRESESMPPLPMRQLEAESGVSLEDVPLNNFKKGPTNFEALMAAALNPLQPTLPTIDDTADGKDDNTIKPSNGKPRPFLRKGSGAATGINKVTGPHTAGTVRGLKRSTGKNKGKLDHFGKSAGEHDFSASRGAGGGDMKKNKPNTRDFGMPRKGTTDTTTTGTTTTGTTTTGKTTTGTMTEDDDAFGGGEEDHDLMNDCKGAEADELDALLEKFGDAVGRVAKCVSVTQRDTDEDDDDDDDDGDDDEADDDGKRTSRRVWPDVPQHARRHPHHHAERHQHQNSKTTTFPLPPSSKTTDRRPQTTANIGMGVDKTNIQRLREELRASEVEAMTAKETIKKQSATIRQLRGEVARLKSELRLATPPSDMPRRHGRSAAPFAAAPILASSMPPAPFQDRRQPVRSVTREHRGVYPRSLSAASNPRDDNDKTTVSPSMTPSSAAAVPSFAAPAGRWTADRSHRQRSALTANSHMADFSSRRLVGTSPANGNSPRRSSSPYRPRRSAAALFSTPQIERKPRRGSLSTGGMEKHSGSRSPWNGSRSSGPSETTSPPPSSARTTAPTFRRPLSSRLPRRSSTGSSPASAVGNTTGNAALEVTGRKMSMADRVAALVFQSSHSYDESKGSATAYATGTPTTGTQRAVTASVGGAHASPGAATGKDSRGVAAELAAFDPARWWAPVRKLLYEASTVPVRGNAPVRAAGVAQDTTFADGHRELILENGLRKASFPLSGWSVVFHLNGDTKASNAQSRIFLYHFKGPDTHLVTLGDRHAAYTRFKDGQVERKDTLSNVTEVLYPDGTFKVLNGSSD